MRRLTHPVADAGPLVARPCVPVRAGLLAPALLAIALLAAWPSSALAFLWLPYNLNSLVMASDAIVVAEKAGTRPVADTQGRVLTLTRYRVKKVLSGALLPGELLEIHDAYSREPSSFRGTGLARGARPKVAFDDDVVMFLEERDERSFGAVRELAAADRPHFDIVHSGLRLLEGGRVYGFAQDSNPGPVNPFPMTRGSGRPGDPRRPVVLEEFEKDIRDSIVRVETLRHARGVVDPVRRRELLLGTLGEYEDRARSRRARVSPAVGFMDARDLFLQGIIDLFLESRDVQGALEVVAIWPWESVSLPVGTALSAAADPGLEPRLRAVAIGTVRRTPPGETGTLRTLEELLDDPEDEVRDAARERIRYLQRVYAAMARTTPRKIAEAGKRVQEKLTSKRVEEGDEARPAGDTSGSIAR